MVGKGLLIYKTRLSVGLGRCNELSFVVRVYTSLVLACMAKKNIYIRYSVRVFGVGTKRKIKYKHNCVFGPWFGMNFTYLQYVKANL